MDFKKIIEKGEIAREEENYSLALKCFDEAALQAGKENKWQYVIEIIGHRTIIFIHHYWKTHDPSFLELMLGEIKAGLEIAKKKKISAEIYAPLLLRWGDYYRRQGKAKEAVPYYAKALRAIGNKNKARHAEFLGFYGEALALSGNRDGLRKLQQALSVIEKDKSLRPFHKLTVRCGINLRFVDCYLKHKEIGLANKHLDEAEKDALVLAEKYKQNVRLGNVEHFKALIKKAKNRR